MWLGRTEGGEMLNLNGQSYKGIPIKLINRKYEGYKAKRFVLGNSNQNVWIPNVYLLDDGMLKQNINIDFVFKKAEIQNKLQYAGIDIII